MASSSKRSSAWSRRPKRATSTPCDPILERYAQPLYGTVILPRLGDTASAEEVLRDTLATAVEKIGRFTWQGKSIYPWLRQIAINKVYDVHRQSKRSRRLADAMVHEVAGRDRSRQRTPTRS